MLRLAIAIKIAALAAACTTAPMEFSKGRADAEDWAKSKSHCQLESHKATSGGRNTLAKQRLWERLYTDCMTAKGWQRVK